MNTTIKFARTLKELRLHLCLVSRSSKGAREFVESSYVELKKCNPGVPILIRECEGIQPKLWVRYDGGKEACINLKDLTGQEVLGKIHDLNK